MKSLLLCFAIAAVIVSCESSSAFGKKLSGSDSLVIHFTDTLTGQTVRTVEATSQKAIEKLSRFVDSKSVEVFKCGYDGNMIFYKNGEVNGEVSFQFQKEGCRHFLYMDGGSLTSTEMNNEATDFLKGLAEGRDTY